LDDAANYLRLLNRSGVDALIVQDIGIVRLAAAIVSELPIHASTQMTLTSPQGVEVARGLGITRSVLARELSLRELKRFDVTRMPLEVFVHGALCVAYSGQCLTSESLGQRSANRGECAQACRMPYELVVDGALRDLGDRRYLLSPQDLAAANDIPALIEAGVESFKIEGRLKSPSTLPPSVRFTAGRSMRRSPGSPARPPARSATASRWHSRGALFRMDAWREPPGTCPCPLRQEARSLPRGHLGSRSRLRGLRNAVPVEAGRRVVFDTGEDTDRSREGGSMKFAATVTISGKVISIPVA